SGTMALWIALGAIGIGPGDEVIVPGYTFIASITSIIYARAVPVLTEIDRSLTLDPEDVKKKITPRTKAIMLVHMLGNPGRVDEIKEIARSNGISLIEDCAQAFGVKYKGKYVGHFGDFGTYSFNVFKTITAGDGGMVATNSRKLYERAFAIHDQGHLPLRQGVERGSRTVIGLDCRMTELSAAVLLAQLKKADMMKKLLKEKKKRFKEGIKDIKGLSFRDLPDPEGELGTLLTVFLPDEKTARKVGDALGCGVVADSGWHVYNNMEHVLGQMVVDSTGCPFTCPYYREKGGSMEYSRGMLPRTDALISRAINISIGVFDAGLGSGFGINITSDDKEIDEKIARFRKAVDKYL
ncbi:MAG: aminotransferase class V-fold PLP-dependent enzyme, partial [Spirochaetes bacterium]|nr:aminotransferase class V-fold PLP-dependent enzyme [Spirochaetota bacterium]